MRSVLAKRPFLIFAILPSSLCIAAGAVLWQSAGSSVSAAAEPEGSVNVTQHHNDDSRDGLFIDPAFTLQAAAGLTRDMNFNGAIVGNVYAQPLYIENGPGGQAMVIAVTESNNVYALNAITGNIIWQRNIGAPSTAGQPCGNINPLGITSTPVVDLATRSLFVAGMTTPDNNATKRHLIFSLNVDTGTINPGWPASVEGLTSGNATFSSIIQNQRGALGIVGDRVYVPYGGHFGDCGAYHGWLIGVKMTDPTDRIGWATRSIGGSATGAGSWAVGGVASDGTNPFIATGNTFSTGGVWRGGEAIIKLQPGPIFSGATTDYWAPTNWASLDSTDTDLGGTGALLVDVPGATPSQLTVAFGKDRNAYVMNRNNLGGVSSAIAQANGVSSSAIIQAPATYRTSQGTYVAFRGSSIIGALRINPTNPPTITSAWTASQAGRGSPFVTTTDGTNNAIVWAVGSESTHRLMGWDGNTGAVVFNGGGANELMAGARRFNTGIAARGRIYLASDNRVYSFVVGGNPTPTPTPSPSPTPTPTPASPTPTPTPTPTPPTPTPTPSPTPTPERTGFDFDFDGKADLSIFRPSGGNWYLLRSRDGFAAFSWGVATDKIAPADYDGDGKTDIAVFRPSEGNWYALQSATGTLLALHFGAAEDLPVPGDFDSDGRADVAVFRPSNGGWWINRSNRGLLNVNFGQNGDLPVVGDYLGLGRSHFAVFRPSNATWYYSGDLADPSHNFSAVQFGLSTDITTPADIDGDGKTDIALYRPSNGVWYWLNSGNGSFSAVQFGTAADIPAAADYDGDGRADICVFRPSNGVWYRVNSSNSSFAGTQFGANGDKPVPAAFR
jgi:hypothetical protein